MASVHGIGVVGGIYPVTSQTTSRIRLCVSSSHTKEMIDKTLEVIDQIGNLLRIKYNS